MTSIYEIGKPELYNPYLAVLLRKDSYGPLSWQLGDEVLAGKQNLGDIPQHRQCDAKSVTSGLGASAPPRIMRGWQRLRLPPHPLNRKLWRRFQSVCVSESSPLSPLTHMPTFLDTPSQIQPKVTLYQVFRHS